MKQMMVCDCLLADHVHTYAGALSRKADVLSPFDSSSEETDLPPLVLQYLLGEEAPQILGDDGQGGNYGTVNVPGSYGPSDEPPKHSSGAINTTVVGDGQASN